MGCRYKRAGGKRFCEGSAARGTPGGGFTLIEILIVITIIIMVFSFAVPVVGKYLSNQRLKAVTGRIARVLLMGRTRAITRHDKVYVLFFHDRMLLLSARGAVPEFFPYFISKKEAVRARIHLRFAGARIEEKGVKEDPLGLVSDLPKVPQGEDWSQPVTARAVLASSVIEGKRVYVAFDSDGTAQFGTAGGPGDRLTVEFWATPPRDADIIVEEQGKKVRGWIDVRATGNVETRISVGEPKQGQAAGGGR